MRDESLRARMRHGMTPTFLHGQNSSELPELHADAQLALLHAGSLEVQFMFERESLCIYTANQRSEH